MSQEPADIHVLPTKSVETETLLTFRLEDQTFGISVGIVSEIIDPQKTTRVPNADALAPTLINVRGSIVPVVDVRYRLGMKPDTVRMRVRRALDRVRRDIGLSGEEV